MDRRKELKLSYKQTPRPMGVLQIKNNINGKIFIGKSTDLPGKINSHRVQLNFKCHQNKEMQKDWDLYGEGAFSFEILEEINTEKVLPEQWQDEIKELENKWLEDLSPYGERGYNKEKK